MHLLPVLSVITMGSWRTLIVPLRGASITVIAGSGRCVQLLPQLAWA